MRPVIAHANGFVVLSPTHPFFNDMNGDRLRIVEEGQQVMITTTFRNNLEETVAFVGIIEVRDTNGVTVFLSWQSNSIEPLGNKTVGVSWLVPESSAYQSRTFAFTDFEQPQVLSPVESVETDPPCVDNCIAQ